jgi:putative spermidine/putrescine transport system permease protein
MADDFHLPQWLKLSIGIAAATTVLFLLLPITVIFPLSFSASPYLEFPPRGWSLQWYRKYVSGPGWLEATLLSLRVGLATSLLATAIGTLAAFGFTRASFRGKSLFLAVILSPILMPGIVVAVAIYFFYARIGLIGSPLGLVLAHTVLATPFVLLTVSASLQVFDRTLELASMSLGGTPLYTFTRVTLPMIRPGILSGAVFAFVTSFDELIVALFVSGTTSVTLPRRMWDGVRVELDPTIAAVAAILITGSALSFGLFRLLQPRRLPGRALRAAGDVAALGGEGLLPSETRP